MVHVVEVLSAQTGQHPVHDVSGLYLSRHERHESVGHDCHQNDVHDVKAVQVKLDEDAEHDVVDVPHIRAVKTVVKEPAVRELQQEDQKDASLISWAT